MNKARKILLIALSSVPLASVAFAAQAALAGVPAVQADDEKPNGGGGPSYSR